MTSETCTVPGCDRVRDKKQNRTICQMHRTRYSKYKSYDLPTAPKLPEGILKVCKKHGELTALQVYKRTPSKDWLSCRMCCKEREIRFRENNPQIKSDHYKKNIYVVSGARLKVTKEHYLELVEQQNNLCAICKKPELVSVSQQGYKPKRLSIDHCHKTNKIRGLLCHKCNISLGTFGESVEILRSAISYLQRHA